MGDPTGPTFLLKKSGMRNGKKEYRDPRQFASWYVEIGHREPDLPEGVHPIPQEEIFKGQDDALWIFGENIATTSGPDPARFPLITQTPHGVDPLGRPYVYVACDNRDAIIGRRNVEGAV